MSPGERVGGLVLVAPVEGPGRARWTCRCDCGATCSVRADRLAVGETKSCGCHRREHTRAFARRTADGQLLADAARAQGVTPRTLRRRVRQCGH